MIKKARTKQEIHERYDRVGDIAYHAGYTLHEYQENIYMVIYRKQKIKINIYLTTMTVTTYLNHPKRGKGQLYRKHVDFELLRSIFDNPRKHTGKGYYTKKIIVNEKR